MKDLEESVVTSFENSPTELDEIAQPIFKTFFNLRWNFFGFKNCAVEKVQEAKIGKKVKLDKENKELK